MTESTVDRPPNRRARFSPHRTDDLRAGLRELIGAVAEWEYAWTADDDERFAGQVIWTTRDPRWRNYWVPDQDLEISP